MAGHSKWANIKHRKARSDAKKGKVFSKIAKEIITAVKLSGPDPKSNTRLRLALQKAKAANMPNENVDRNIKKASSSDQADYDEVLYEVYAPGGVGILCEGMTDNKNRAATEVRIACQKNGGSVAGSGAVAFNFDHKGVIQITKHDAIEDELFEHAIDSGAQDIDSSDENFMVITDPTDLHKVLDALEHHGYKVEQAELEYLPKLSIKVESAEEKEKILSLVEALESIDDIDSVYHNLED